MASVHVGRAARRTAERRADRARRGGLGDRLVGAVARPVAAGVSRRRLPGSDGVVPPRRHGQRDGGQRGGSLLIARTVSASCATRTARFVTIVDRRRCRECANSPRLLRSSPRLPRTTTASGSAPATPGCSDSRPARWGASAGSPRHQDQLPACRRSGRCVDRHRWRHRASPADIDGPDDAPGRPRRGPGARPPARSRLEYLGCGGRAWRGPDERLWRRVDPRLGPAFARNGHGAVRGSGSQPVARHVARNPTPARRRVRHVFRLSGLASDRIGPVHVSGTDVHGLRRLRAASTGSRTIASRNCGSPDWTMTSCIRWTGAGRVVWVGRQYGGLTRIEMTPPGPRPSPTRKMTASRKTASTSSTTRRRQRLGRHLSGGVSHLRGGRFETFTTRQGLVSNCRPDHRHARRDDVVRHPRRHQPSRERQVALRTTTEGLPANDIAVLVVDRDANVWAGTTSGLAVLRPSEARFRPIAVPREPIVALLEDAEGALWCATTDRLVPGLTRKSAQRHDGRPARIRRRRRARQSGGSEASAHADRRRAGACVVRRAPADSLSPIRHGSPATASRRSCMSRA